MKLIKGNSFHSFQNVYNKDKELPIFKRGNRERYTAMQAFDILLATHKQKCSKVPLRVRQNMAFIIDVGKLKHWQDVKSDMNGVYSRTLRIATWIVEIDENKDVEVVAKKKLELVHNRQHHLYIHSTKNVAGFCRSIFLLRGHDGEVINGQCLLQYTIVDKDCNEVNFEVAAHGNSKGDNKPYYPSKKSTIEAMKKYLATNSPSVAFSNALAAVGGMLGAREPGDLPRSKKQTYDLKNKRKKPDPVEELLQYCKHKEEPIILEHHDVPEDLWVLGKKHMTSDLSRFCTSQTLSHPFSVDPTFSFGQYEVTPFTYKHFLLKCKRTGGRLSPLDRQLFITARKRLFTRRS